MARNVPKKVVTGMTNINSRAGSQILDIITSGMYNNPLMIIREYIQNAADSIDEAVEQNIMKFGSGQIDIEVDGSERCITILDNGIGVPSSASKQVLGSVAVSTKNGDHCRGFRGIGRLGGVGYCDQVVFESRTVNSMHVDTAVWDAKYLRGKTGSENHTDLLMVIRRAVSFKRRKATKSDLSHFFRVKLYNVHRFHRDALMSVRAIREYVSQIAPVPFEKTRFTFAGEINHQLQDLDGYRCYDVSVNGKGIFKPHSQDFGITGQACDQIKEVRFVDFRDSGGKLIGKGWYAVTSLLASIPPRVRMRGIRIRQGNIEVGNEYHLSEQFAEQRFATWHIGEIHLAYCVKLNARRDGFEDSQDYESFLERVNLFANHLSFQCRNASKRRSQVETVKKALSDATSLISSNFYVCNRRRMEIIELTEQILLKAGDVLQNTDCPEELAHEVKRTKRKLKSFVNQSVSLELALEGRRLRHMPPKTLLTEVFTSIVDCYDSHRTAESLIGEVIRPYIKN